MDVPSSSCRKTVHFNVGGNIYKVSRSLLEQHPDTMLARLASDTWRPVGEGAGNHEERQNGDNGDDDDDDTDNDDNNNTALFIERDGE